jgi:hypothetical protein
VRLRYFAGLPLPRAAAGEHGFGEDRSPAAREGEELRVGAALAERAGFEPALGFLLGPLSKRVPSASRSPLQVSFEEGSANVVVARRASRKTLGFRESPRAGLGSGRRRKSDSFSESVLGAEPERHEHVVVLGFVDHEGAAQPTFVLKAEGLVQGDRTVVVVTGA